MTDREERIREIAHRLWEQEGRPPDQERRHWEIAERMVDEEDQAGANEPAPKLQPTRAPRAKAATPRRKKTSTG